MRVRRRVLPLAVAVVALLACSDDPSTVPAEGAPGSASTTPAASAGGTTAPGATTPDGGPVTTGGASDPGGGGPTPTDGATPGTDAPPVLDGNVNVGHFAPAILRPDLSQRVVVELQADVAPSGATVDHLVSVLESVTGKRVDVVAGGAPGAGARNWDGDAIRSTADAGAATAQGNGVAVLRLLFVHGDFNGDTSVLGIAVRGDVAAVFVDQVVAAAGLLGSSTPIEVAVATHEVGHLLGLVDLELATNRGDPDHPGHSTNPGSVMYWAVESDLIGQLLGANPPNDFDGDDRADLATIRDGG